MMTREQALENLNLPPDATEEEIVKAYQRMVRRYPPEFHPERFRRIDESYRTLTSLAYMVESIMDAKPATTDADLVQALADLPLPAEGNLVDDGIREIRTLLLYEALWPGAHKTRSG